MNAAHGHEARAAYVPTHLGFAWQAQCSCGWLGARYWAKGAKGAAQHERWSHELDAEDGILPAIAG